MWTMWTISFQLATHKLAGAGRIIITRAIVDNVDNLFLGYPQCPQARGIPATRERGAGKVWTMWTMWTPILNRWLITFVVYIQHFYNLQLYIYFKLSTMSTKAPKPDSSGVCILNLWTIYPQNYCPQYDPPIVHKYILRKVLHCVKESFTIYLSA